MGIIGKVEVATLAPLHGYAQTYQLHLFRAIRLIFAHKNHQGEVRCGGPLSVVEIKATEMQTPKMRAMAAEVNCTVR